MKVMVVDDDASVRESLGKVLRDEGYDVVLATDGIEAWERVREDPIDLLLLDINLPGPNMWQNGWDVFESFTRQDPGLPIVIITGQPGQYAMALAAGVSALLEKPLDVPRLLETLRDVLAEPKENRLRRMTGYSFDVRHVPPEGGRFFERRSNRGDPAPPARRALESKDRPADRARKDKA